MALDGETEARGGGRAVVIQPAVTNRAAIKSCSQI